MIEKIFKGDYLKRLDNIIQWQEQDVFKKESVAQHSYKVAIFARIILEDIFGEVDSNNAAVNDYKLKVVTLALFHDWDEALIRRDISHTTKYNPYNGVKIREQLDNLSHYLADENFGENTAAAKLIRTQIGEPEKHVKVLVKLCDWLALQFYVERELSLGNVAFQPTHDYCIKNLSKASQAVIDMLKSNFKDLETKIDYSSLEYLTNYTNK